MAFRSRPEELVGMELEERYRILRLIGQGGMGAVYEARHIRLNARVAVKVLDPRLAQDPRERKRFLREARSAVRIQSDHVVKISDFGEEPTTFFVMEFLEGQDLDALLGERGRLDWPEARRLVLPVVHALHAAHDVGIVHRDVKPSNIFLTRRPDGSELVKVLDFGIAKVVDTASETHGVTRTNEVIGTLSYIAPEQVLGRAVDRRTDIYSLGIVLFQLLSGAPPFRGSTAYEICDQHIRAPRPNLADLVPSVPPAVSEVVRRAMASDARDRFPNMMVLARALEEAVPASGPIVTHGALVSEVLPPELRPSSGPHPVVPSVAATALLGPQHVSPPPVEAADERYVSENLGTGPVPVHETHRGLSLDELTDTASRLRRSRRRRLALGLGAALLLMGSGAAAALHWLREDVPGAAVAAKASPVVAPSPPAEPAVDPSVLVPAADAPPVEPEGDVPEPAPSAAGGTSTTSDLAAGSDEAAPADVPEPTPKPKRREKRKKPEPRETPKSGGAAASRPAPDLAVFDQIRQAVRASCELAEEIELTLMIAPEGSILDLHSTPRNRCAENVARTRQLRSRAAPERRALIVTP